MKIIDIDRDLSSLEEGRGFRYLVLDMVPNVQWTNHFLDNHKTSMDLVKRPVSIRGNNILVECCMDEIQHQIDTLNALCKTTDDQIQSALEESYRAEQERVRQHEEKRKSANKEFGKLKF